jgi:hypothetical protein
VPAFRAPGTPRLRARRGSRDSGGHGDDGSNRATGPRARGPAGDSYSE